MTVPPVGFALRTIVLSSLANVCMSPPGNAAEWQLTPNSRLASGYTDNPRFLPEGGNDEIQNGAELGAQLTGGTERLRVAVTPRATFSRYRTDQSLDTNNQYLGLTTSWQTERVQWSGDVQLTHDSTQTSELGTTGLVQNNSRRDYLSVGAGPRWTASEALTLGANAQWNDVHYADDFSSGLADYTRSSASLSGALATSDRTRITLSVQGGELQAASRQVPTRDAGLTLGLNHELGPRWSLSVAAGPSWADSGADTLQGTLYSANIVRKGEVLQLTAGGYRRLEPVGTGLLALIEGVTLSAAQRLSERLSVSLSGQANRTRELFGNGSDVRYSAATGSLSWNYVRAWTLSFSVEERYQEVASNDSAASSADSYRVWLGLGWNGRTLAL